MSGRGGLYCSPKQIFHVVEVPSSTNSASKLFFALGSYSFLCWCFHLSNYANKQFYLKDLVSVINFASAVLWDSAIEPLSQFTHSLAISSEFWAKAAQLGHIRVRPWILGVQTKSWETGKSYRVFRGRRIWDIHKRKMKGKVENSVDVPMVYLWYKTSVCTK